MSPDLFGLRPVFVDAAGERALSPAALAGPKPCIDEEALAGYLCFSHVPTPRTIFAGVERLALRLPWTSAQEPTKRSQEAMVEELSECLLRAVARCLPPGDAPLAVALSGGLDSSLIAALLVALGRRVCAFTLDFGPPHDAEAPVAEAVARHLKIPLRRVDARPAAISRALDATVAALPQPFGDAVVVPLYLLGEAASTEAETLFNGEGGDQLFGGWANKPMVAALLYEAGDDLAHYRHTYHRFDSQLSALWPHCPPVDIGRWLEPALDPVAHPGLLHRLRAANIALKGAQNIAPRCLALGSCHGLRVEAPLFDSELAALTFTLPPEAFLDGAIEKPILKRVAARYLPEEIVWRTKRGMGAPAADWCLDKNPVRKRVDSLLSARALRREGRFDPAFVARLRKGDDPSPAAFRRRRVGEKLWTLALWEAWRRHHLPRG